MILNSFQKMLTLLEEKQLSLAGAVQDFTDPGTGKSYMLFPIRRLWQGKNESITVRLQELSDVMPSREQKKAYTKKAGSQWVPRLNECLRRRVTLPHPAGCSTITVPGLSFRVRKGTGRHTWAMATAKTTTDGPDPQKRGPRPAKGKTAPRRHRRVP